MDNHYSNGVRAFWIDADEGSGSIGESDPFPRTDAVFAAGSVDEIGLMYPFQHQRALFEAMAAQSPSPLRPGGTGVVLLSRSAWAGSARFGAAVWSGDIGRMHHGPTYSLLFFPFIHSSPSRHTSRFGLVMHNNNRVDVGFVKPAG